MTVSWVLLSILLFLLCYGDCCTGNSGHDSDLLLAWFLHLWRESKKGIDLLLAGSLLKFSQQQADTRSWGLNSVFWCEWQEYRCWIHHPWLPELRVRRKLLLNVELGLEARHSSIESGHPKIRCQFHELGLNSTTDGGFCLGLGSHFRVRISTRCKKNINIWCLFFLLSVELLASWVFQNLVSQMQTS